MVYRMGGKELVLLLFNGFFWGIAFLFIKIAVTTFPPCTVVAGRLFFASISAGACLLFTGSKLPKGRRYWKYFLVLGLSNCTLPYLLISWSQIYIDSGLAAILGATMPIFTLVLSIILIKKESLTWQKGIGLMAGLLGVILLIGPEAMRGLGHNLWAQFANIGAAFIYAYAVVYGAIIEKIPPLVLATGQMIAGFITILPFALLESPWTVEFSMAPFLALVALGIICSTLPFLIYFHLLRLIGPTNLSLVSYLMPLFGVLAGIVFLQEAVNVLYLLALLLILSGVAGVSGFRLKKDSTLPEQISS